MADAVGDRYAEGSTVGGYFLADVLPRATGLSVNQPVNPE